MHLVHTTKSGRKLFISQMDDDHLKNTINLKLDELQTITTALTVTAEVTPLQQALYGMSPNQVSKSAREQLAPALSHLYPYIAEAVLRNKVVEWTLTERLQKIMARTGADPAILLASSPASTFRKLPSGRIVRIDDDDDDDDL